MTTLRQADLKAALDFLRDAGAMTGAEPFPPALLERLRQLVPCDLVHFCELDRLRERVIADTHSTGERFVDDPEEEEQQCFWRLRHEHPICAYHDRTGDFSTRKLADFVSRRAFHRTEIYSVWWRELGRPEFELEFGLPAPPWHTKVFLFHSHERDFRERDRAILEMLRPHLAHLDRSARMRRLAAALRAGADARGELIVLDAVGNVDFATARARRLLHDYCNDGRDPRLPPLIEDWLSHKDPRSSNGSLAIDRGEQRLVVTRLNGDDRTLLLTEERVAARGISWRELQVLGYVGDGKSNAEIAATLCISPATVRTHLEHIYAKLGVHSRTAALARLREADRVVPFD